MPRPFTGLVPSLLSLWLLSVSTPVVNAQLDPRASVTIDQLPDYSYQRLCGRGCVQNNYGIGEDIENVLGCTWNECYCASTAEATSIIASCWSAYCGGTVSRNSPDVSTAISLYNAYCAVTSVETVVSSITQASPAATETSVTITISGSPSRLTTVFITSTNSGKGNTPSVLASGPSSLSLVLGPVIGYSPTSLYSSSPSSTSTGAGPDTTASTAKKGYSTADKIALGVGLGVGIPTLIATIWTCCIQVCR